MDKISELKEKLAEAYVKKQGTHDKPEITRHDFNSGVDAFMELQLPVKFAKWLKNTDNGDIHYNHITKETSQSIGFSPSDCYLDDFKTEEELYDHWLENIYQPEK